MITSIITIRVRFPETDAVGFVYHARYLEWMDAARVQMLDDIQFPYKRLQSLGVELPVIQAHIDYYSPARFDDKITIKTIIEEEPKVKLKAQYSFFIGEQKIANGYTIHVFMNKSGKATKPPSSFKEHLKSFYNI